MIENIITPNELPFKMDDKIFQHTDEDGGIIGEPYSYNDWIKELESIAGVSEDLFGHKFIKKRVNKNTTANGLS